LKSSPALVRVDLTCRNCGAHAPGKFCPECGQDTDPRPPSAREFINHFFGNYIAVKGSFIQTLWRLVSKPGQLTVDYLAGRKRAYILPLRLYITISVIALVAASLVINFAVNDEIVKIDAGDLKGNLLQFGDIASVKFEGGKVECTGEMPESICTRLRARFGSSPEAMRTFLASMPDRMVKYMGYGMFALMPFFALLMKVVYFNRRMHYGEHIVFALHLHAVWWLFLLAAILAPNPWGNWLFWGIPLYAILSMRRVYRSSWMMTLLRAAVVSLIYLIALFVLVVFTALFTLLF
jgi:hypothetical protein